MFWKSEEAGAKPDGSYPPEKAPDVPPPSFKESMSSKQPVFKTKFACVTLNRVDRIRLLNFPASEALAVQEVIKAHWSEGISRVRPYGDSTEIQVHGMLWYRSTDGNDYARRLVLRIMERLFDFGWVHQTAIDVTRKESSKDSLLFRKQDPPPSPCEWIAISFDRSDKLKIVGAPPKELREEIVKAFGNKIDRHESTDDRLKIKFRGTPWHPTGTETVETSMMLLTLLEALEEWGFTVYASIDMSSHEERETDVLICQRQRDWKRGAPVWHR